MLLFTFSSIILSTASAVFAETGDEHFDRYVGYLPSYLHAGARNLRAEHRGKPGRLFSPNANGEFVVFYMNKEKLPMESFSQRAKTSDYACETLYIDAEMTVGDKTLKLTDFIESNWAYPTDDVIILTGSLKTYTYRCRLSASKIYNFFYPGTIAPKKAAAYAKSSIFIKLDKDFSDHETIRARNYGVWKASCPMVGQTLLIQESKAYCETPRGAKLVSDAKAVTSVAVGELSENSNAGTSQVSRYEAPSSPMLTVFLSLAGPGSFNEH